MDEDQLDNLDDAFKMYTEAAELCLRLVSNVLLSLLAVFFCVLVK